MEIVILSGREKDFCGPAWDELKRECKPFAIYGRTSASEAAERIGGAEIVFMNAYTDLTGGILAACPNLRFVGVLGTGYNTVDIEAARRRGIAVTNVPGYSSPSVAQHLFALMLERTNSVCAYSESVRKGEWMDSRSKPVVEVSGKTLGVLGFGSIGQRAAAVAVALGMKVSVFTRTASRAEKSPLGVKIVSLDELFRESDFLTLHAPLSEETRHIVNARTLAMMKTGAMIINTARGGLVDEAAVRAALESGQLGCYAADVVSEEPIKPGNPLLGAPNCIITPHVAWSSIESRRRLFEIAAENLKAFLRGERLNRIV